MGSQWHIGIDTGGTFTDLVAFDGHRLKLVKVPSSPRQPGLAIQAALQELGLSAKDRIHTLVVGTTVATNAVLEGKGARVALVTNRGFADHLTLGRQQRFELFNLNPEPWEPPVPAELCFETAGRITATGEVSEPLDTDHLTALRQWIEQCDPDAVAVNLLHSYLRPDVEQQLAEAVPDRIFCSLSSEVLPEQKEYERGIATWLNAAVGPVVRQFVDGLDEVLPLDRWSLMRSDATTVAFDQSADQAVRLLLSGPAGGLAAALHIGQSLGATRLLTLDMGGTSSDVAMLDGKIQLTRSGTMGRYPVAVPMVDMHTIGAGGGSIARLDTGGALRVGPESAGADPGPACYGRGGNQATVTDANVVLGRIPPGSRLGGSLSLDGAAAESVMDRLADDLGCSRVDAALGVIELANEQMAQALRVISVERGASLENVKLVSFGGAGGLHVCELAERLELNQIIVPVAAGVLSAFGMLVSPAGREASRGVHHQLESLADATVSGWLEELQAGNLAELTSEGAAAEDLTHQPWVELRYLGQGGFHRQQWTGDLSETGAEFETWHVDRFGYQLDQPVEVVNIGVSSRGPAPVDTLVVDAVAGSVIPDRTVLQDLDKPVPVYARADLGQAVSGPCVISDAEATIYVPACWTARLADSGPPHLLLDRHEPAAGGASNHE